MKMNCCSLIVLLLLATLSVTGQTKTNLRPSARIESRQGNHPDGPDMIGHAKVSQGDRLMCTLVEVYDESHESATSCMIRFGPGPRHTLAFGESVSAPQNGDAYLECAGDKPRRCMVKVNPPLTNPAPAQGS